MNWLPSWTALGSDMKFLPNIKVRTIVIFDKRGEFLPWDVAQGKYSSYFGIKDTIELNMDKIIELDRNDLVAEQMVKQWLLVKILIDTREDLEVRGIREHLPGTYEQLIFNTNLRVIYETPHLKRYYTNMAIENILNGEWIVDDSYGRAYADLSKMLRYWLDASTDLENLRDKVYLNSLLEGKKKKAKKVEEVVEEEDEADFEEELEDVVQEVENGRDAEDMNGDELPEEMDRRDEL